MDAKHAVLLLPGKSADGLARDLETAGWTIALCHTLDEAREHMRARDCLVGMVLLEASIKLPHEALEEFLLAYPLTEWIALLDASSLDSTEYLELISRSFYDYHTAPFDVARLLTILGHACGVADLKRRCAAHRPSAVDSVMIGNSRAMQRVRAAVRKVAEVDAPVLINGESGTGKELVARAIHQHSRRASGAFVAVNCGALPPNLIQSELFGYERGAFTGATSAKNGLIESAVGGTVFLDEIGDLPLELQTTLLRFLQEKTISRIGSTRSTRVDVRVIAATHVNLERAIVAGRFREDLYYRLHVLHIETPALREREGDVELLAQFFLEKYSREQFVKARGFTRRAIQAMRGYSWPGNVRELINRVHRATVMSEERLVTPQDLGLDSQAPRRTFALDRIRADAEREAIRSSLQSSGHNISQAARSLGVSRVTLYRLMEKHDLNEKTSSR